MATKMRKTIAVDDIKATANKALSMPDNEYNTEEGRRGIIFMVESVLHATANYKGFRYTNLTDEMKDASGYLKPGQPADDTRRHYH